MYRKNQLRGCCLVCFGLGLMVGHGTQSWILCFLGGLGLLVLGCCLMNKRR